MEGDALLSSTLRLAYGPAVLSLLKRTAIGPETSTSVPERKREDHPTTGRRGGSKDCARRASPGSHPVFAFKRTRVVCARNTARVYVYARALQLTYQSVPGTGESRFAHHRFGDRAIG